MDNAAGRVAPIVAGSGVAFRARREIARFAPGRRLMRAAAVQKPGHPAPRGHSARSRTAEASSLAPIVRLDPAIRETIAVSSPAPIARQQARVISASAAGLLVRANSETSWTVAVRSRAGIDPQWAPESSAPTAALPVPPDPVTREIIAGSSRALTARRTGVHPKAGLHGPSASARLRAPDRNPSPSGRLACTSRKNQAAPHHAPNVRPKAVPLSPSHRGLHVPPREVSVPSAEATRGAARPGDQAEAHPAAQAVVLPALKVEARQAAGLRPGAGPASVPASGAVHPQVRRAASAPALAALAARATTTNADDRFTA